MAQARRRDPRAAHYQMGEERIAALAGVGFQIAAGEMVAIIGSSGSGKSTLLNILGCLDTPTSGHYRLDGKDVQDLSDDDALSGPQPPDRVRVPELPAAAPRDRAVKNVALPLVYRGTPARERRPRAAAALEPRSGSPSAPATAPPDVRAASGSAPRSRARWWAEPSLLLCDEPTGNLDSATSETSWRCSTRCTPRATPS
jgi:putative ABC transport system ATP-binding protein